MSHTNNDSLQLCELFFLLPCSLNSIKPSHLILITVQMAERNPGIDSVSVVSPAKQTSRDSGRLAFFFFVFVFWKVMDAEDSLAVGWRRYHDDRT